MRNMNKITLQGYAGKDAEQKVSQNGTKWTALSLATSRSWKGKNGQWEKETTWHNIVAFGDVADQLWKARKGWTVFVMGRMVNHNWTQNGEKRTMHKVHAEFVCVLGDYRNKNSKSQPSGTGRRVPSDRGHTNTGRSGHPMSDVPW